MPRRPWMAIRSRQRTHGGSSVGRDQFNNADSRNQVWATFHNSVSSNSLEDIDRFVKSRTAPLEAAIYELEGALEAASDDYEDLARQVNGRAVAAALVTLMVCGGVGAGVYAATRRPTASAKPATTVTVTPSVQATRTVVRTKTALPLIPSSTFSDLSCQAGTWVVFLKSADGPTARLVIADALSAEKGRDRKRSVSVLLHASDWEHTCPVARDKYADYDPTRVFLWAGPVSGNRQAALDLCMSLHRSSEDCIPYRNG